MKINSSLLFVLLLCGCTHGPYRVTDEKRFPGVFKSIFSRNVVTDGSATLQDGSIYFGMISGEVVRVDRKGSVVWSRSLVGSVSTTPLVVAGKVYVGTTKGTLYALSMEHGKEIWHTEIAAEILGEIRAGEGTILFGTNDGTLYVYDQETGEPRWRYHRPMPDRITIRAFATPSADTTQVLAAFSDGSLVSLRASDGMETWRQTFPVRERFSDVVAPLVLQGSALIATQFYGTLYSLNLKGNTLWSHEGGGSGAAPLFWGSDLVVPSSNHQIVLLDAKSGEKKRTIDFEAPAHWSGLSIDGDRLFASTYEGKLHIIDLKNAAQIWTYSFSSALQGAALVDGDRIWVLTRQGELFTLAKKF